MFFEVIRSEGKIVQLVGPVYGLVEVVPIHKGQVPPLGKLYHQVINDEIVATNIEAFEVSEDFSFSVARLNGLSVLKNGKLERARE